jgi:imidazole glycerol-phosphate synthase subunit HisH
MIAVLDYGIGNLRSAEKALRHAGGDARLVTDPRQVEDADAVVLPGVGAFGACMAALRASGLDGVAIEAAQAGKPFLGICVGMQLLYEESEESPGVAGLGILGGAVRKMETGMKLPQMQWNRLNVTADSPLLAGLESNAWFYFVHSYAAESTDEVIATCSYGGKITAVVQRGNLFATQFHPEKSSDCGLRLLSNFVEIAS